MNEPVRVGALLDAHGDSVRLFGYGEHLGNQPCEKLGGRPNPKIKLDSGKIVWGCECWWGPEEKIKKLVASKKIVIDVDIDDARGAHHEQ
jgi:hypothetical protein